MRAAEQERGQKEATPNQIQLPSAATQLLVVGTSYKLSNLGFREALVKTLDWGRLVDALPVVQESAVLSTCNRFELYLVTTSPDAAYEAFLGGVRGQTGLQVPETAFSRLAGVAAVRHLFRVAAGLESVVVGEPQVLTQVRAAGIEARRKGDARGILSPLFDRAVRVGLKVRASFDIGSGEASLSDLAVDAIDDLRPVVHDVMLVGSGKMVQLAARRLKGRARRIYVASKRRTAPEGLEGSTLVRYSDIRSTASKCDVLISATTAARPLLGKDDLKGRRRRLVVDLGMPRNVSASVRDLPNVRLIDLDDLAKMAHPSRQAGSLGEAEAATSREASEFYGWLVQTRLSSTLADLYAWANGVRQEELERALRRLNSASAREVHILDAMGRRIMSKLMARPAQFARRRQKALSEEEKLDLLRSVFGVGASGER